MIAIIDYGMGNIHSVRKALEVLGGSTVVTNTPAVVRKAEKIVLPGVGAFGDAMKELQRTNMAEAVFESIKDKKIFLGICLGMHLLFESSQESPQAKGLGVFKGSVRRFEPSASLKVPHMGWNQVKFKKSACPLFKGLETDAAVYFCHSYYPAPADSSSVAATTEYGTDFASILWQDNVYAMQFHPEKSQRSGLKLLENFVSL
jgi:glutamine amidotransferase